MSLFLVLVLFSSLCAIHASDVNQTIPDTLDSNENILLNSENQTVVAAEDSDSLGDDSIELIKNNTEISSQSSSISYKGSYNVVLKDSNSSAAISNKTINFIINNVNYNASTDDNGVARLNLDLNPGKYSVNAVFEGDDEYFNSTFSTTVEIKSPINANSVTKYYKASVPFTAQFFNTDGNALANRWVTVTVNGKSHSVKTNARGVASLQVNLKPGSYNVVSTDPVTGYRVTTSFTILSTIAPASKLKKVQGETFYVKFLKSNGKPLAKKKVKVKFRGKTYKKKTNSNGVVGLSLKKVKKGTYNVACYNLDGLSKTFKIKVYSKKASTKLTGNSYTFLPGHKRAVQVKLSTALGDSSNSGRVVKVKIAGKTYSKKTDGNGVASFDLSSVKKGIHAMQYSFGGNKYFKASKLTRTVKIYDTVQTALTVKSTTHFGHGAGTSFKLAYTAGGVPLSGKDVTINVAGRSYIETTDSKGMVSIPINLAIGDYVVDYSSDGGSGFAGTSGSCDIDVFQRGPSKVIWKCGSSYKDNSQTFKVRVTDGNGKATSGGVAVLTIDGEQYTSSVSSKGYATFKTSVDIGKYKVTVNFNGNNDLLEGSSSKSVTVKLSKYGKGINEKHAKALKAYLKSSSHCKVGSKAIKKLVKSLTKGLTSKTDKAKAIFNYVRDTLGYSYYYNTKYGASTTLKLKRGNCVDHSHLLVSMFRTAGLHARYVHGRCHFTSSGDVTGHVWTQVKIGKTWVCGDATSYRNSLGKIKNWNTKHYTVHARYASLPF
ncbi:transglutaminase-like domain-containing protein [uncultured Methanobrevibacter sp.]|uniref:transglutaminase-like domain-containing protein n=1 Tax=uncultured Methanobrevibacter sp. TaxID=253161 RepID=UPI0025D8F65E|nr:transglutaminase-like domain-containing protein [uncultured Methanobrevibacter sp.]